MYNRWMELKKGSKDEDDDDEVDVEHIVCSVCSQPDGDGNDILSGTGSTNGLGSIDTLTGGNGNDRFILSSSTTVFYNDGNNATSGLGDYALIKDFSSSLDKIQLEGSASRYVLGTSPIAGVSGTAIYLDTNGNKAFNSTDELIAVVQGSGGLSLASSYFSYV
jgi:Ca2+-binding RTX toxin-like protein